MLAAIGVLLLSIVATVGGPYYGLLGETDVAHMVGFAVGILGFVTGIITIAIVQCRKNKKNEAKNS